MNPRESVLLLGARGEQRKDFLLCHSIPIEKEFLGENADHVVDIGESVEQQLDAASVKLRRKRRDIHRQPAVIRLVLLRCQIDIVIIQHIRMQFICMDEVKRRNFPRKPFHQNGAQEHRHAPLERGDDEHARLLLFLPQFQQRSVEMRGNQRDLVVHNARIIQIRLAQQIRKIGCNLVAEREGLAHLREARALHLHAVFHADHEWDAVQCNGNAQTDAVREVHAIVRLDSKEGVADEIIEFLRDDVVILEDLLPFEIDGKEAHLLRRESAEETLGQARKDLLRDAQLLFDVVRNAQLALLNVKVLLRAVQHDVQGQYRVAEIRVLYIVVELDKDVQQHVLEVRDALQIDMIVALVLRPLQMREIQPVLGEAAALVDLRADDAQAVVLALNAEVERCETLLNAAQIREQR